MLTLAEVKLHCRIDGDDEDALLESMIDAATAAVGDYINSPTPLDATAPAPVKAAALLLVGSMYAFREDLIERPMHSNPTFARLLNPYRVQML